MIPYYRIIGNGSPLIVLHGVFGSSDNWQSIAKSLGENFQLILVDLRNHGKSEHSNIFDFPSMTQDLLDLLQDLQLKSANFLGHSLGGKVVMNLATLFPEKVEKLVVVDITPKVYPPHHHKIFEGLKSVDLSSIKSRSEAESAMALIIPEFGIRQFLLKNLTRNGDDFSWKLNIAAIEENIEIVGQGLGNDQVYSGKTLFIAGGNSDYITQNDWSIIKHHFPNADIQVIKDAGHWIHAEKPKELISLVSEFLAFE